MTQTHHTTGHVPIDQNDGQPAGHFTHIDGDAYYCIQHFDRLEPFLMSIVSDSDHWMYISSNSGLTAGRANPDLALFPYDSEDKLHHCHDHTGPRTAIWIKHPDRGRSLWEPFTESARDHYHIVRNLYKRELGNAIIFEEINQDLEMTFRYRWCFSETFGFVRRATLANAGDSSIDVTLLDGLLNVLPYGVTQRLHLNQHCLVDAYKHCAVDPKSQLGIFSLSSMITDRPEPGETTLATSIWSRGLDAPVLLLRPDRIGHFRNRRAIKAEPVLKGRKGAFLLNASFNLEPGQLKRWHIVAEVAQDQGRIVRLRKRLNSDEKITDVLANDCRAGDERLRRNIASADGLQTTGSQMMRAHHFANVLFNNMRGGVFDHHYDFSRDDLKRFIQSRNRETARRREAFFANLADVLPIRDVIEAAEKTGDADLQRLCYEYLPLYFSRRHGDPSRPWNHFDIRLKDEQGRRKLAYQGNWRDIFQNWEALCQSFPGFLPSVIAKFVNASTADGFNPYRITSDGIDWEVVEEDNPWSNIGYWGDHQIIYLLKLLEALRQHDPAMLTGMLTREIFSYADVPYEIKPYDEILKDPHNTILFNREKHRRALERTADMGADGRLVLQNGGGVYHVSLTEKLLVPALAKLSNLVLDGGIWLNTQRPEWNDANNALVGNGLSVVTTCYLRRYLTFCGELIGSLEQQRLTITEQVATWLERVTDALRSFEPLLDQQRVDDRDRKRLLDALGSAFSDYRQTLYAQGLSGQSTLPVSRITDLIDRARRFVDHSIRASRRDDGMYHAYNLMHISADGQSASISHLYEMLEGQVAALSCGLLSTEDSLRLTDALTNSALKREDQNSYLLYPNRKLPGFLEKNLAPAEHVKACELLTRLIDEGDSRLIYRDDDGHYRFASSIHNQGQLGDTLALLAQEDAWRELVDRDARAVKELFERVYNHKAFTGRSGGMYGYEGLGCIYWHMVAKLLLAVQENHTRAVADNAPAEQIKRLARAYRHVRSGLGFNKTPVEYGAFPSDPYSHTPGFGGARQPGMTGQVKEEILTRRTELGVRVDNGALRFEPTLLIDEEFLRVESVFKYYSTAGEEVTVELPEGSIAFTVCQTPVVYHRVSQDPSMLLTHRDGQQVRVNGYVLTPEQSREVFNRTGAIARIDVMLKR